MAGLGPAIHVFAAPKGHEGAHDVERVMQWNVTRCCVALTWNLPESHVVAAANCNAAGRIKHILHGVYCGGTAAKRPCAPPKRVSCYLVGRQSDSSAYDIAGRRITRE